MDLLILPIATLKDNYVWTVVNTKKKCALIVDPGEAEPVLQYFKQHDLTLCGILITHHHWDHTNGIAGIKKVFDVPVFAKQKSIGTVMVKEGDVVMINEFLPSYHVLEIPGHTLDHLAYYNEDSLFCGDTLFAAGCGRLFEGNAEQMYQSLQKMAALSQDTKVYCAHEYTQNNLKFAEQVEPANQEVIERLKQVKLQRERGLPSLPSSLGAEKATNPFLRCELEGVIARLEERVGRRLNKAIDVFAEMRKWKDGF